MQVFLWKGKLNTYDLFPYPVEDTRILCFGFSNEAEVINMLDDKEGNYKNCKISIGDYSIHFANTSAINSAHLLSFVSYGEHSEINAGE